MTTKAKAKKTEAKPGYKGHQEGSRKAKVHELFDRQGDDAAWTLGIKLKLKENTLRSWFGEWHRVSGKKRGIKSLPRKAEARAAA